jgi:hypothetical protein
LADEVEHGEIRLLVGAPQPPTELLEEDGGALGGPEKQDGVDLGDVETLVEELDSRSRAYSDDRITATAR